jgi:signal peptidase II
MRRFHFLISLGVILLDQFTKWLVNRSITLHDSVVLIPGFLKLTNVQNQGAAFGLFADSTSEWRAASLILFSVIAMCIVTMLLWRNSHQITMTGLALSLILGGAAGNLWDRMMHGHVVDFLDFFVGSYHWPAFNVADSAIVVGAFVLMGEILFAKPAPAEHAAAD